MRLARLRRLRSAQAAALGPEGGRRRGASGPVRASGAVAWGPRWQPGWQPWRGQPWRWPWRGQPGRRPTLRPRPYAERRRGQGALADALLRVVTAERAATRVCDAPTRPPATRSEAAHGATGSGAAAPPVPPPAGKRLCVQPRQRRRDRCAAELGGGRHRLAANDVRANDTRWRASSSKKDAFRSGDAAAVAAAVRGSRSVVTDSASSAATSAAAQRCAPPRRRRGRRDGGPWKPLRRFRQRLGRRDLGRRNLGPRDQRCSAAATPRPSRRWSAAAPSFPTAPRAPRPRAPRPTKRSAAATPRSRRRSVKAAPSLVGRRDSAATPSDALRRGDAAAVATAVRGSRSVVSDSASRRRDLGRHDLGPRDQRASPPRRRAPSR